ncbi:MAG: hypothetical protein U1E53_06435 [Dongiaceae bacterium]
MRAGTAQIVDLQAYRQARGGPARGRDLPAAPGAALPVVWYPVWMLVPVVMVPR